MQKFRSRRPSGSMFVALLALFVALGGSSYAALTITSSNIKNGTIKGLDIHSSTITGSKLKNNTLNGRQINESRLGTVPSATNATNAISAANAASAGTAANVSGLIRWHQKTVATAGPSLAASNDVVLATAGPFTIKGKCFVSGANTLASTTIATSQDGAATQGYSTGGAVPQNVSDGDKKINEIDAVGATATHVRDFRGPYDGSWAAQTRDGSTELNGFANQAVWQQGATGPACEFSGFIVVV